MAEKLPAKLYDHSYGTMLKNNNNKTHWMTGKTINITPLHIIVKWNGFKYSIVYHIRRFVFRRRQHYGSWFRVFVYIVWYNTHQSSQRISKLLRFYNGTCSCKHGTRTTCDHDDVIKWNLSRVTGPSCGQFTSHRWIPPLKPVTQSFDVSFDLRLIKRLSTQSRVWWFETASRPLWRHCNDIDT